MDHDYIASSACDCCRADGPGVLFHDTNGVPVLFECRTCNPAAFERMARRDIADWLRGSIRSNSPTFGRAA